MKINLEDKYILLAEIMFKNSLQRKEEKRNKSFTVVFSCMYRPKNLLGVKDD